MVGKRPRDVRAPARAMMVAALLASALACGTILDIADEPAAPAPDSGMVSPEGRSSDGAAGIDADASAASDADAAPGVARPIAFVTTGVSNANFQGVGGANTICVATAADAGLPGSYRAYLQLFMSDPDKRLVEAGTYYRVDGQPIFESFPPVDAKLPFLTERGQVLAADAGAWTGVTTEACSDWTDLGGMCSVGAPSGSLKEWQRVGVQSAAVELHVYCFGD